MRQAHVFAMAIVACTSMFSQNRVPTVKVNTKSAFVWGEDAPLGAISSIIEDPLTGNAILRLSYAGIQVSSRMGFERVGGGTVGEYLGYTTTIVNSSQATISVQYGGISVDGHAASPLFVASSDRNRRGTNQARNPQIVTLEKLHCFTSGFLASDNLFSAQASSQGFTVAPGTSLIVSSVIRDPRNYSIRCSLEGCYPTGTIRYYMRVGSRDYVFVWPGRSVVHCGP
jgi:hypothetical protein